MGKRIKNKEHHDFYCLQCGNRGIPILRGRGYERERFHRKKLYCIYCKEEVNHMELRNDDEIFLFKEAFAAGEFIEEAKESIDYIRAENAWKNSF